MAVGGSNQLLEYEALAEFFDRFLLHVRSDNVPEDQLQSVLHADSSGADGSCHPSAEWSDHRGIGLQRLVASSALMCSLSEASFRNLWAVRYTWDMAEQIEVLQKVLTMWSLSRQPTRALPFTPGLSTEVSRIPSD